LQTNPVSLATLLTPHFKVGGLHPLLDTTDFEAWSAAVGANLGEHRSDLCSRGASFYSRMAFGQSKGVQLLHIEGHGEVQLDRVQGNHAAVLWLPLQGYSEEEINGTVVVAEPGMALLMRPGDVLKGRTSRVLEGLSILLPSERLAADLPRLIDMGVHHRTLIGAAHRFADALAAGPDQGRVGAEALLDQLDQWQLAVLAQLDGQPEPIAAARRHSYVGQASAWMRDHLHTGFDVAQVAGAIHVSVRTLQYAFLEETGQTPMAHAKRLRLRCLRALLQDPGNRARSIATLMQEAGLLACGATAADYRSFCGETPRQTRQAVKTSPR
jgi:AraC-like DNA-binding protein